MDHLLREKFGVYRCDGFGICRGGYHFKVSPCPMFVGSDGFESHTPRGVITIARGILEGSLAYTKEIADLVYRCTMCGNCRLLCGAEYEDGGPMIDPAGVLLAMRADLVENSLVPPPVRDFFKNVHRYGNPFGEPAEERGKWGEGLGLEEYEDHDYLFYVGCEGSYDERGKRMAVALSRLMALGGVSFGILGEKELCEGNEVRMSGETGLFQWLADRLVLRFTERGVRRIVTLSPHAYNAFRNDYPALAGGCEVVHYTQLLKDLLRTGRLRPLRELGARVTYHDPCFLGRRNEEYDAPREILRALQGADLIEMPRTREDSLCCGGGGGNFFTDMLGGGENSPSRMRVREAHGTGAQVLVVACPVCAKMFEDAAAAEGLDGALAVRDVSEVLLQCCSG